MMKAKDLDISRTLMIIIITHLLLLTYRTYAQNYCQNDSVDFNNAINAGLRKYLELIPMNREYLYGFNNRDEFNNIKLGDPLQVFIIQENSFKENNSKEAFIPVNRWKIPLIINDDCRCFLDIVQSAGEYKAVGIGLHDLARDLDTYEKQEDLGSIRNKGLFLDYSINGYFIVTQKLNKGYEFRPFRPILHCNSCEDSEKEKYTDLELFELLKTKNENLNVFK